MKYYDIIQWVSIIIIMSGSLILAVDAFFLDFIKVTLSNVLIVMTSGMILAFIGLMLEVRSLKQINNRR